MLTLELSNDQIDKRLTQLSKRMGAKQASVLLSALGKNKQFLNALDTSVGQELLKDAISGIESRIHLVLNEKDEPKIRAEIRAYLDILNKWQKRINEYNKNKEAFNKNAV